MEEEIHYSAKDGFSHLDKTKITATSVSFIWNECPRVFIKGIEHPLLKPTKRCMFLRNCGDCKEPHGIAYIWTTYVPRGVIESGRIICVLNNPEMIK